MQRNIYIPMVISSEMLVSYGVTVAYKVVDYRLPRIAVEGPVGIENNLKNFCQKFHIYNKICHTQVKKFIKINFITILNLTKLHFK